MGASVFHCACLFVALASLGLPTGLFRSVWLRCGLPSPSLGVLGDKEVLVARVSEFQQLKAYLCKYIAKVYVRPAIKDNN